jgi:hypothetical protein
MRPSSRTAFFSLVIFSCAALVRAQTLPSQLPGIPSNSPPPATQESGADQIPATQPAIHKTDLLGPQFVSHVHGIEFRPPINSVQLDRPSPDSIAEFDIDKYDWQLKAWSTNLQQPLPLTIHKDQFGNPQDGVVEVTLANIKQQTPTVQVLRNEVINVGRIRVGMIAVRYENAAHERRFTQQAIIEAPDADNRLYYFLDLTGPGKPKEEPEDIVNPAEKLAFDTFAQVVDSVVLLDRQELVEFQKQSLYSSMGLFVLWNARDNAMIKAALHADQYRRILRDGQDIGFQHIVETLHPDAKSPDESTLEIGIRSRMSGARLNNTHNNDSSSADWDTETWLFSSANRKHEHWKTAARCTSERGKLLDSFSQVGVSDEQTRAFVVQPQEDPNGSLLPSDQGLQRNVDIATRRSLEVTTTHKSAEMIPLRMDVPAFYIPQAFSFLLPEILPLKPKTYMFATFVPNTPENSVTSTSGNVEARYVEVLPVQHVKFHGQEFDAVPITDKITLDGPVATIYMGLDGQFLGSTTLVKDGDQSSTLEVLPTDSQTLDRIWSRPDLAAPNVPPADPDNVLPGSGN